MPNNLLMLDAINRLLRAVALGSVLVTGAACLQPATPGASCPPGEVARGSDCRKLCSNDTHCDAGQVCDDGLCRHPSITQSEAPTLTSIDGDGSPDGKTGHAQNHFMRGLVLQGANLAGATVSLASSEAGGPSFAALAIRDGATAERLEVALPHELQGGAYRLQVVNSSGTDEEQVLILQGEAGGPGLAGFQLVTSLAMRATAAGQEGSASIAVGGEEQFTETSDGFYLVTLDRMTHALGAHNFHGVDSVVSAVMQLQALKDDVVVVLASRGSIAQVLTQTGGSQTLAALLKDFGANDRLAGLQADEAFTFVGYRGMGEGNAALVVAKGVAESSAMLLDRFILGERTTLFRPDQMHVAADQSCASGQVVLGIDGQGHLKCVTAASGGAIQLQAGDGISINNGIVSSALGSQIERHELASGSVDGAKIADSSITSLDIEDGSINSDDIADGSIALADLGMSCPNGQFLKRANGAWGCGDVVAGGSYVAGTGILISEGSISVNASELDLSQNVWVTDLNEAVTNLFEKVGEPVDLSAIEQSITSLNSGMATKANTVDVYSKPAADARFAAKADVYLRSDLDPRLSDLGNALALKANKAEVYLKSEVDAKIVPLNTALGLKADKSAVYAKSETDAKFATLSSLSTKADASDVYTKVDANKTFASLQLLNALAGAYNSHFDTIESDIKAAEQALLDMNASKANASVIVWHADLGCDGKTGSDLFTCQVIEKLTAPRALDATRLEGKTLEEVTKNVASARIVGTNSSAGIDRIVDGRDLCKDKDGCTVVVAHFDESNGNNDWSMTTHVSYPRYYMTTASANRWIADAAHGVDGGSPTNILGPGSLACKLFDDESATDSNTTAWQLQADSTAKLCRLIIRD